ncbi:hypothetical protein NSZ01_25820 [Nocardioides szechwanensis]|uniref:Uncharacterized protein n=1 Tax=Nocardioides szechwanensis TaxID=1005944 RepID=A0A1H0ANN1_9ACTN|nr:hypothetical protein [Nocardioides szechwanensis]GEP34814.1 hypothetical protein NSZ01_25820 [Nocardioides szechwanensis]SDN34506.1 hypothetical protein SAMN05192576_2079 [Nocardioides szechwanensis]
MLPTLNGRIQTRIFMLAFFGSIITLLITPVLPGDPDYRTTFIILATVLVLGVIWEVIYHGLMQWRWEKDWPTLFGLLNAINEGILVWVLLELELVPGIEGEVPFSAFLIMFLVIWLFIWVWTNGPMRIFNIRWRFFGGRLV